MFERLRRLELISWYPALVSKHQKAGVYVVISILGLRVADCTRRVPLSSTSNDWSILGGGRSAQDCSLRWQIISATRSYPASTPGVVLWSRPYVTSPQKHHPGIPLSDTNAPSAT